MFSLLHYYNNRAHQIGLVYNDTGDTPNPMNYTIRLRLSGKLAIYENNRLKLDNVQAANNDVLSVEVENHQVHYKLNGNIFYSSATAASTTQPLIADFAFYSQNTAITDVVLETDSAAPASNLELAELPVYGSGRIGVYYPTANSNAGKYMYELSDHLGNVRALISKGASGEAVIEGYSDYYPFGWKQPGPYPTSRRRV